MAAFSITPVTGLYVLALSKLLDPVVDVVTRVDFHISGPLDAPKLIEAGRDRARIKLNQQQKEAVDAATPKLPAATPFLLNPQPVARASPDAGANPCLDLLTVKERAMIRHILLITFKPDALPADIAAVRAVFLAILAKVSA